MRRVVPGLLRDPVASLVGDWDWVGGPGLPHAYAQVADACMEGVPKELTPSPHPTLAVGFSSVVSFGAGEPFFQLL